MPILDADEPNEPPIIHAANQTETQADYSALIKKSFLPRLFLLLGMSVAVLMGGLYLIPEFSLTALFYLLSFPIIMAIPFIVGLILGVSVLFIYVHLFRETLQMWADLRTKKVIIYESTIIDKHLDLNSDTPHHVSLRHIIDKRQRFRISPQDFARCAVGSRVQVVLSFHAKLLLALRV